MPQFEEHLLQHLLALRAVHEDAEDQSEHSGGEGVVQLGERSPVAVGNAQEQVAHMVDGLRFLLGHVEAVDHHIYQHALPPRHPIEAGGISTVIRRTRAFGLPRNFFGALAIRFQEGPEQPV